MLDSWPSRKVDGRTKVWSGVAVTGAQARERLERTPRPLRTRPPSGTRRAPGRASICATPAAPELAHRCRRAGAPGPAPRRYLIEIGKVDRGPSSLVLKGGREPFPSLVTEVFNVLAMLALLFGAVGTGRDPRVDVLRAAHEMNRTGQPVAVVSQVRKTTADWTTPSAQSAGGWWVAPQRCARRKNSSPSVDAP